MKSDFLGYFNELGISLRVSATGLSLSKTHTAGGEGVGGVIWGGGGGDGWLASPGERISRANFPGGRLLLQRATAAPARISVAVAATRSVRATRQPRKPRQGSGHVPSLPWPTVQCSCRTPGLGWERGEGGFTITRVVVGGAGTKWRKTCQVVWVRLLTLKIARWFPKVLACCYAGTVGSIRATPPPADPHLNLRLHACERASHRDATNATMPVARVGRGVRAMPAMPYQFAPHHSSLRRSRECRECSLSLP